MKNKSNSKFIAFRKYLNLEINRYLDDSCLKIIDSELLTEVTLILSNYQEEGAQLFPVIFITSTISDVLELCQGVDEIKLGSLKNEKDSILKAFKVAAPLSEGREWAIFFEIKNTIFNFGIFRSNLSPLNPTPFEKLRSTKADNKNIIGLTRSGSSVVEIRISRQDSLLVNVSGAFDEFKNPKDQIKEFMDKVSQDISEDLKNHVKSFYYRVGIDLLYANHGALLLVIKDDAKIPSIIRDGVILEKNINVSESVKLFCNSKTISNYQQLLSWNHLLRRMFSMDGITILNTSGAIVGYNCFIETKFLERKYGGARLRAFKTLKNTLNEKIVGVLYKSQDGNLKTFYPSEEA